MLALGIVSLLLTQPHQASVDARFEHARSLESLGETESAIEAYRLVLELSPYHRAARFRLGTLLVRSGREEAGQRLLQGYESFRLWDRQVSVLRTQIASGELTRGDRTRKTLLLADLLMDGGAMDEAERVIDSGRAADPEEPLFDVAQARRLFLSGQLDDAAELLQSVLARDATIPEAHWVTAQIHARSGRTREALTSYRALVPLWPDMPPRVRQEVGTAFAMNGQLSEAISHFEQALASEPNLPRAHADLGLALAMTGRSEEAELHFREALKLYPELVAAQQGLASLMLERGEALEAVALFRESVELRPRDPVLRRNLANALQHAGRAEEAQVELERAYELESRR